MTSPYKQYSGVVNEIKAGSKGALIFEILDTYSMTIAISGILLLLGLAEIIFSSVLKRKKEIFSGALHLGAFSFLAGTWIIAESKIIHFFILARINPLYSMYLHVFDTHSTSAIYNKSLQTKRQLDSYTFRTVLFTIFVASCIMQITGLVPFIQSMIGFHILVVLSAVIMITISIKELKAGNQRH